MNVEINDLVTALASIVDGMDGYECEHGSITRYWHPANVDNARKLLNKYKPDYEIPR